MNANEVIESYITDVAVRLPRKQRNDVAFELRELLDEGLRDRAEAAGSEADAALAIGLVRGFGRPEEIAARYRPTLNIIDPADGHDFLRATIIGLVILWAAGLVMHLGQAREVGRDFVTALGGWWGGTLIPSLWWPGLLVVGFALASWARRRWPNTSEWRPRADDRIRGGRRALVMGVVGILFGLFVLLDPHWVLDVFFAGQAAPEAYEALTYTDTFRHRQGPWIFLLLLLDIPMLMMVIVNGRWSVSMRRLELGLSLVTSAVLAWTVVEGPVMLTSPSDQMVKLVLVLVVAYILLDIGSKMYRRVRPTPSLQTQG